MWRVLSSKTGTMGQASMNGVTLGSCITGIEGVDVESNRFDELVPAIRQVPRPLRLNLIRPRFRYMPRSPAYGAPCIRLWAGTIRVRRRSGEPHLDTTRATSLESVFLSSGGSARAHVLAFVRSDTVDAEEHGACKCFGLRIDSDARRVAGHITSVQVRVGLGQLVCGYVCACVWVDGLKLQCLPCWSSCYQRHACV